MVGPLSQPCPPGMQAKASTSAACAAPAASKGRCKVVYEKEPLPAALVGRMSFLGTCAGKAAVQEALLPARQVVVSDQDMAMAFSRQSGGKGGRAQGSPQGQGKPKKKQKK